METSKKINAGDTLTVGDLTDAHLGAFIEVETMLDITYRFTLGAFGDDWYSQKELWTPKACVRSFYLNTEVKVITPPPVVQPDEPKVAGQCIRIEGDDEFRGVVADPGSAMPIMDHRASWRFWGDVLRRAGDRQIIVSDPPRWPDETPEVPERIEVGEWPDDDTHLREWEWIDNDSCTWRWGVGEKGRVGWTWYPLLVPISSPHNGPWTRGERVK